MHRNQISRPESNTMNTSAWFFRILIIILILISCTISLYTLNTWW